MNTTLEAEISAALKPGSVLTIATIALSVQITPAGRRAATR
ncbi:hypothetical protein [Nocardia salmonicida]